MQIDRLKIMLSIFFIYICVIVVFENENVPIDFCGDVPHRRRKQSATRELEDRTMHFWSPGPFREWLCFIIISSLGNQWYLCPRLIYTGDLMCLPRHKCCCEPTTELQSTLVGVEDDNTKFYLRSIRFVCISLIPTKIWRRRTAAFLQEAIRSDPSDMNSCGCFRILISQSHTFPLFSSM